MAKMTMVFGVALVLLGGWGFWATGSTHPTALIPSYAGIVFVIFGALAETENSKRRMLWMHIAVTVALLLFLGMIPSIVDEVKMARGVTFPHPVAVVEKAAMAELCLLFVLLCVRSFISARRARKLAA